MSMPLGRLLDAAASVSVCCAAAYCAYVVFEAAHGSGPMHKIGATESFAALVGEVSSGEPMTVVAAIRRDCPACEAETEFLRQLVQLSKASKGRFGVVLAFPRRQGDPAPFLQAHGLGGAVVRRIDFPRFGIAVTPLLVLSRRGVGAPEVWAGAISGRQAEGILDRLRKAT